MFGFPKVDRSLSKDFKRNFLKSVIRQVKFAHNQSFVDKKGEIESLLKSVFPRVSSVTEQSFILSDANKQNTTTKTVRDSSQGYQLKSQDGQKVLTIATDSITLEISGNAYTVFEDVEKENPIIDQVCHLCGSNSFSQVSIRKVNIFGFNFDEDSELDSIGFAGFALNEDLHSNFINFPSNEIIEQSLHTVRYVNKTDIMNLKYGLIVPSKDQQKGEFVIDIDVIRRSEVSVSDLKENLVHINDEIFNVFNWMISNNIVDYLKENENH